MKRLLFVLAIAVMICMTVNLLAQPYEGEKGDVDNNSAINVLDMLKIANKILGIVTLDDGEIWRADCNDLVGNCEGDGSANVLDMVKIANIIMGNDSCPRYAEEATVLDESTIGNIASIDTAGVIKFSQRTADLDTLESGDVIFGEPTDAAPSGFLKKVESVTVSGDTVIVTTTDATLEDVFEQATLDYQKALTFDDLEPGYKPREGIELYRGGIDGEGFYLAISDVVLYDYDGNMETREDQIRANGSLEINPEFEFKLKIKDFRLRELRFVNKTVETAELTLFCGVSLSYNPELTLDVLKFSDIIIWVGWVPVVIKPILSVDVGAAVTASVGFETGVTQTATLEAGIRYIEGTWDPVGDFDIGFGFIPPQVTANVSVKGYVGPQLSLLMYGIAGPYADINGYLELLVDVIDDPWWELYGGVELGVGVEVRFLGKEITDYYIPAVIGYRQLIAQAEEPINTAPTASFTVTPPSGMKSTLFNFDASGSSDNEDPTSDLQVRWRWKDGDSWTDWTTTKTATYQYSSTGTFNVTLEVKDTGGLTDDETHQVTISEGGNTVTDIDGNVYQTVTIGGQVWMAENLKVTHYRNGDPIPNVTDNTEWAGLSTSAYCNYNNDAGSMATYGCLYNWYAVDDSRNVAPVGWHVPTDDEWKELEMYLGMSQSEADGTGWRGTNEGSKLAGNASLWASGDLENDPEFGTSGFSALPAGGRYDYGYCYDLGYSVSFWSASEGNTSYAWYRYLNYYSSDVYRYSYDKRYGFSVRCVRD